MIGQFINSTRFCHWVPSPLMLPLPVSKIYEDENDDSGNKHIYFVSHSKKSLWNLMNYGYS